MYHNLAVTLKKIKHKCYFKSDIHVESSRKPQLMKVIEGLKTVKVTYHTDMIYFGHVNCYSQTAT